MECTRCGLCCFEMPCIYGEENDKEMGCIYLDFDIEKASCRLLTEDKIKPKNLGIGDGCTNMPKLMKICNEQIERSEEILQILKEED